MFSSLLIWNVQTHLVVVEDGVGHGVFSWYSVGPQLLHKENLIGERRHCTYTQRPVGDVTAATNQSEETYNSKVKGTSTFTSTVPNKVVSTILLFVWQQHKTWESPAAEATKVNSRSNQKPCIFPREPWKCGVPTLRTHYFLYRLFRVWLFWSSRSGASQNRRRSRRRGRWWPAHQSQTKRVEEDFKNTGFGC